MLTSQVAHSRMSPTPLHSPQASQDNKGNKNASILCSLNGQFLLTALGIKLTKLLMMKGLKVRTGFSILTFLILFQGKFYNSDYRLLLSYEVITIKSNSSA